MEGKETNPKDLEGLKRVPMGLFPQTAVIAGAMAFLEGHLKYRQYNWRDAGVRASIYNDALLRHMSAWWNGEDIDIKSGLPHLWKAIACLAILIDSDQCGNLTDDRPPPAPVQEMQDALAYMVERMQGDIKPSKFRLPDDQGAYDRAFVQCREKDAQVGQHEMAARRIVEYGWDHGEEIAAWLRDGAPDD